MGLFSKLFDSMKIDDEDEYYDDDEYEYEDEEVEKKPSIFSRKSSYSDNIQPQRKTMEVTMVKPTTVEDSRTICDLLLSGKAVVLNVEGLQTELAQRIIDFTSGATYSMSGKLQKISNLIFIATPSNVDLSGDFQDLLNNAQFDIANGSFRF